MKKPRALSLAALLILPCLSTAPAADAKDQDKDRDKAKDEVKGDGIVTGLLKARTEKLKLQRVEADGRTISAALLMYRLQSGDFPTEKQGLKALVEKPDLAPFPRRWVRIMDKVPQDAWGREYRLIIRVKDDKPIHLIVSDGPDLDDLADDIEMPVKDPTLNPPPEADAKADAKPDAKPEAEAKEKPQAEVEPEATPAPK
ncbi:type II secretion system protein GspG [Luteolibacter flavescens]|uniref:Type II secretion system protein GspG n=1 Tax=Luteolibacter flavescens TaxID=1859460 RepID=A0ABT3FUA5_9BACT|nr:type II secretion system protein GspG [Luteolibacter flavescens]MCW1887132.1 type II secretion system protein GspG [Luteolibacter flavescens]